MHLQRAIDSTGSKLKSWFRFSCAKFAMLAYCASERNSAGIKLFLETIDLCSNSFRNYVWILFLTS